ncbi:MAG: GTPase Era [Chloroflexi bacterium]|nr:GTPase Era [Chloroflexota bacterium]
MTESAIGNLQSEIPATHRSGFVAVVGRPNVGKSTLVNALLGEKVAIVSPKPQTTRNRLLGILTRDDAQVIFVDTPGIHRPLHRLGEVLLETAVATLPDADLALWVVDVSSRPNDEDRQVAGLLAQAGRSLPVILALNKADRLLPEYVKENTAAYAALAPGADSLLISATRGDNLAALLTKIIATLPLGPRYYPEDQYTDQQERFMAAELVREQVLLHLHDEVPHGVAVAVNEFKERHVPGTSEVPGTSPGMTYISATIYVERETHKPILLGKGGEMLKAIGQGARREIESLLGVRVYLDLWVKVRPKWRMDEQELLRLGYASPVVKPHKGGARPTKRKSTR